MRYDDTYKVVVHMAKAKMVMNSHKGNIEDLPPDDLINKAKDELDELRRALGDGDQVHIIEEVADIMNYAVAAAHQAIEGYRTRK